jgi:SAM-dependent methyltransferase
MNTARAEAMEQTWEESFAAQVADQAYNTAPVEALVRTAAYYLRSRYTPEGMRELRFLEMGCGAGPNLVWLAQKGIEVSGIDISATALRLCEKNLRGAGLAGRIGKLIKGSVTDVPLPDQSFDGIFESCVFQHLDRKDRSHAFAEVGRLLKPGGLFVGYMLDQGHTTFQQKASEQLPDDPGTLMLNDNRSGYYLTNIGLAHFFSREEYYELLRGFSVIDPCLAAYYLPKEDAKRRGYAEYLQSMWIVYAVK